MVGKGILSLDAETGVPSRSVWVFRAVADEAVAAAVAMETAAAAAVAAPPPGTSSSGSIRADLGASPLRTELASTESSESSEGLASGESADSDGGDGGDDGPGDSTAEAAAANAYRSSTAGLSLPNLGISVDRGAVEVCRLCDRKVPVTEFQRHSVACGVVFEAEQALADSNIFLESRVLRLATHLTQTLTMPAPPSLTSTASTYDLWALSQLPRDRSGEPLSYLDALSPHVGALADADDRAASPVSASGVSANAGRPRRYSESISQARLGSLAISVGADDAASTEPLPISPALPQAMAPGGPSAPPYGGTTIATPMSAYSDWSDDEAASTGTHTTTLMRAASLNSGRGRRASAVGRRAAAMVAAAAAAAVTSTPGVAPRRSTPAQALPSRQAAGGAAPPLPSGASSPGLPSDALSPPPVRSAGDSPLQGSVRAHAGPTQPPASGGRPLLPTVQELSSENLAAVTNVLPTLDTAGAAAGTWPAAAYQSISTPTSPSGVATARSTTAQLSEALAAFSNLSLSRPTSSLSRTGRPSNAGLPASATSGIGGVGSAIRSPTHLAVVRAARDVLELAQTIMGWTVRMGRPALADAVAAQLEQRPNPFPPRPPPPVASGGLASSVSALSSSVTNLAAAAAAAGIGPTSAPRGTPLGGTAYPAMSRSTSSLVWSPTITNTTSGGVPTGPTGATTEVGRTAGPSSSSSSSLALTKSASTADLALLSTSPAVGAAAAPLTRAADLPRESSVGDLAAAATLPRSTTAAMLSSNVSPRSNSPSTPLPGSALTYDAAWAQLWRLGREVDQLLRTRWAVLTRGWNAHAVSEATVEAGSQDGGSDRDSNGTRSGASSEAASPTPSPTRRPSTAHNTASVADTLSPEASPRLPTSTIGSPAAKYAENSGKSRYKKGWTFRAVGSSSDTVRVPRDALMQSPSRS